MTNETFGMINGIAFVVCVGAILLAVIIGGLGIWGLMPMTNGLLWKVLSTCGVLFAGSVSSSMAIRCFKTDDLA